MPNEPEPKIIAQVDRALADIVPGFLENRQKDCKLVLAALEKVDYETIRILGHSMKGVGGGYGFNPVTDLGASVEQAAKDKNMVEIQNLINELMIYLERVKVVYVD